MGGRLRGVVRVCSTNPTSSAWAASSASSTPTPRDKERLPGSNTDEENRRECYFRVMEQGYQVFSAGRIGMEGRGIGVSSVHLGTRGKSSLQKRHYSTSEAGVTQLKRIADSLEKIVAAEQLSAASKGVEPPISADDVKKMVAAQGDIADATKKICAILERNEASNVSEAQDDESITEKTPHEEEITVLQTLLKAAKPMLGYLTTIFPSLQRWKEAAEVLSDPAIQAALMAILNATGLQKEITRIHQETIAEQKADENSDCTVMTTATGNGGTPVKTGTGPAKLRAYKFWTYYILYCLVLGGTMLLALLALL